MIPGAANPLLMAGDVVGYQIQRSLRFRRSASAYLNRTFVLGNRKTWTWSGWVKRGDLSVTQYLFSGGTGGTDTTQMGFNFQASGALRLTGAASIYHDSLALFRDPSAHYHVVVAFDTTNATANDRIKMYVNGVQLAVSISANPTLNLDYAINQAATHRIGDWTGGGNSLDGYLSEVNFIDGQALTPSSFGQTDATTGQWSAKKYTGTYGTNGFYLDFSDTSSTTNLCLDRSGNANNWTPNNISLTAGVTYDSMTDVPLGYGTTDRGNYCTLNPVRPSGVILSNANLTFTTGNTGSANYGSVSSTIALPAAGQFYFEVVPSSIGEMAIGIHKEFPSSDSDNRVAIYYRGGGIYINGTLVRTETAYSTQTIGVAIDVTSSTVRFYQDNAAQGAATSYTPGSGALLLGVSQLSGAGSCSGSINFGQRPFAYAPPTGFKALHTGNLTSDTVTVSGSFTGNLSTDGPPVWCNGTPETLTINGNAVTFGTHADKTAGGFKLRSSSASYNNTGSNTWTATILSPSLKSSFRNQLAKANP